MPANTLDIIKKLRDQDVFSDFDVHFAELFTTLTEWTEESVLTAIALTSYLTAQGHICVDLSDYENKPFPLSAIENQETLLCPPLTTWLETLRNSPFVGRAGDYTPFILHEHRLYLYRYWEYEQQLVTFVRSCLQKPAPIADYANLRESLLTLFPEQTIEIDWQKIAVLTALFTRFCLISGGPGTGKTFTVAKILALLLMQTPNLRIALAAPTGKATARLQRVIASALETFDCPETVKALIPRETFTLHRLLGSIPHSPYFRHTVHNLLPFDVIVIDEVSMVDLALMAKLVQAIPPSARLILVGDKDQLASIEAGTVLGDICAVGSTPSTHLTHWIIDNAMGDFLQLIEVSSFPRKQESTIATMDTHFHGHDSKSCTPRIDNTQHQVAPHLSRLRDCIVFLEKNYRFATNSDIAQLANYVRQGHAEHVLRLLKNPQSSNVKWRMLSTTEELLTALRERVIEGFSAYFQAKSPEEMLQALEKFRILSALRQGPLGVITLNRLIEQILVERGMIRGEMSRGYHKQPIMITENDYSLELFNGDVGVILRDPSHQQTLRAFFLTPDGDLRTFLPTRLPTYETVYAMTIHKSQGSEFDQVLMLLPQQFSMLLSRELLYTGITRAKQYVELWANELVLKKTLKQNIQRKSGLYEAFKDEILV